MQNYYELKHFYNFFIKTISIAFSNENYKTASVISNYVLFIQT